MSFNSMFQMWSQLTARNTKRIPANHRWGFETEQLESRALLSSIVDSSLDSNSAELASIARSVKQSSDYPDLTGIWNLTGTGTTTATGTLNVTPVTSENLTAVFNITGLPPISANLERHNARLHADVIATGLSEDVHLKGKYNKTHDEITLKGKVSLPDQGTVKLNMVFAFNNNVFPTSFTLTITDNHGDTATLSGSRLLP